MSTRISEQQPQRSGAPGLRIGELALRAGVSTRTLRYYEELGLLAPSHHSDGGARRYSEANAERLSRIRELQELMGLNLDEIRTILLAEDRLQALRSEYRAGDIPSERRTQIVREAIEINTKLRQRVTERVANMQRFLQELEAKALRYQVVLHGSPAETGDKP
ncbi:MAG: MerR family transcriptional regulator [Actinomycetota bacterium]|nr:MerR family transcriptional regulator [Actinomycetota bacterium]